MKTKRQYFVVQFIIKYKNGKFWVGSRKVTALTDFGAREVVKWIYKDRDIKITSVEPTYKYVGSPISKDYSILGDF